MRAEEFSDRLRRGAASVAAQVSPAPAGAVRRRGERRRQRAMLVSGVLVFLIGAGGGGYAYAAITAPHAGPVAAAAGQSPAPGGPDQGRPVIVAVSTAGVVVTLNAVTGVAVRTLTGTQDVVGDQIAVSPDRSTVYFAVHAANSCTDEIESVPLAGGRPAVVATGVLPAISPDGRQLAFVREQLDLPAQLGCAASGAEVVVLNLADRTQSAYPAPPGQAVTMTAVRHLSWSPDGKTLLVTAGPVQGNDGGQLNRLDLATDRYYLPGRTAAGQTRYVPAATAQSPGSYFEEGVYLPDGDLFVDRMCCTGGPAAVTSSLLQDVDGAGQVTRQVAQGYVNRVHSSLDAVPGWLLYLSGTDLYIARDGQRASTLATGYVAAVWAP